jgi:hypothetical protein
MTDPKIADPIVFNYEKSHLKLTAIRQTLSSTKASLTWRETSINEDPTDIFTYKLDPTGSRASDMFAVTLNKPGLYQITSNIALQQTGTADGGLTIDVAFPGQATFEIAYSENNVTDFDTVGVTLPFRVLLSQVGTRIFISGRAATGTPTIRGYSTSTSAYFAGGHSGSFVDIVFEGP